MRDHLARPRGGDRLFVPAEVAAYLATVRELGVSERQVRAGRILMYTASPETPMVASLMRA